MKLGTVEWKDKETVVLVSDEAGLLLPVCKAARLLFEEEKHLPETLQEIIEGGESVLCFLKDLMEKVALEEREDLWIKEEDVQWLAPLPKPRKNIFCVGKNYADHAIEMGSAADIPEHAMIFTKAPTAAAGHNRLVPLHEELTDALDYEGELAVVIGKKGFAIREADAEEYIFGYTILNDITARDLQAKHKQFFLGKSLDGSCPMGPFIVHKSALRNPDQLSVRTWVNGELRQDGNTSQFIFPITEIIEVLSKGMTLEPGDIIATGTPAGVGKGFKPPRYLKEGDRIDITIEQIGTLSNVIG